MTSSPSDFDLAGRSVNLPPRAAKTPGTVTQPGGPRGRAAVDGRRARAFRKIRSDSRSAALSLADKETLFAWLAGGKSYEQVKALVKSQFGIKTSTGALSNLYSQAVSPRLVAQAAKTLNLSSETLFALIVEIKPGSRLDVRVIKGPKSKGVQP